MNCRAQIPNSSIPPTQRIKRLPSTTGDCHQGWFPASGRGKSWKPLLRNSRLACGPWAALGHGGAVGEQPKTKGSFYDRLGIPKSGSFDDIKRAYKQLARKYHPDVSPLDRTEEYTQLFIEVKEAYETLSDPAYRALYDRNLALGLRLAISTRRQFDEELAKKFGWKNRWQDQVAELNKRSMTTNSNENLSWGARMRRRRVD